MTVGCWWVGCVWDKGVSELLLEGKRSSISASNSSSDICSKSGVQTLLEESSSVTGLRSTRGGERAECGDGLSDEI